ncbi:sulfurtransferase complex subunit TusD [Methylococcus sp. EFPC2]|uniref:sulfurtransferase complex subunit TusD n=1 Tax=Methylococcus sp. EFPC2 TaxID=2812648 RepID=UPI001966E56D|nr:sulfurtransferase complex subunit TusD [Methylococcus sp. EFPC2]QSA98524.1 sulfurtransferase complex subunit TusD [Methylococcus sp. EFPC2]
MKYAIQVNYAPWQSQGLETAYQFIKAALARGHHIVRIFFYHDGVLNAGLWQPAEIRQRWTTLHRDHGIDMVLCISAAQRRGLVNPEVDMEAASACGMVEGFRVAGLALWVDACLQSDRVMVFG